MTDRSTAWIRTLPEGSQNSNELRQSYERYKDRMGYVSKFIQLFSLRPEVIGPLTQFQFVLGFGNSSLGKKREELLNISISAWNNCDYCQVSHTHSLRRFLGDEEADRIVGSICNWGAISSALQEGSAISEGDLDNSDLRMLAFAHKLTISPGGMQKSDVEDLRAADFTDQQVLDIVAVTAWRNFVNRVCEGLGVEPEASETFSLRRV